MGERAIWEGSGVACGRRQYPQSLTAWDPTRERAKHVPVDGPLPEAGGWVVPGAWGCWGGDGMEVGVEWRRTEAFGLGKWGSQDG
jgi:hypothetical protein